MVSRRADDFRIGIAMPLLRSLGFALVLAALAVGIGAAVDNMVAFYAVMVIGVIAMWLLDARLRPNKAAEDAARRRYFGLDE